MTDGAVQETTGEGPVRRLTRQLYRYGKDLDSGEPHRVARARRTLARLRRSITDRRYEFDVMDLVAPLEIRDERRRQACIVLVGLYALNPRTPVSGGPRLGLGAALAEAEAPEARVRQLISADRHALPNRLRQAVTLIGSAGVPLDYGALGHDLLQLWTAPAHSEEAHRVHLGWAADFKSHEYQAQKKRGENA